MKLLIDHQAFSIQTYGGVSRYIATLAKELRLLDKISVEISSFYSENIYFQEIQPSKKYLSKIKIKKRNKILDNLLPIVNRWASIAALKRKEYSVFFPTYYDNYFLRYLDDKPFVLTVYDMIHELFPEHYGENHKTIKDKRILIEKAHTVVAISENTKKDILNLYPHIPENKVKVIYLASSLVQKLSVSSAKFPKDYLLFVGTRKRYKNWKMFIEACGILKRGTVSFDILCVGGGAFNQEEIDLLHTNNLAQSAHQMELSENELAAAYANAKAFVFPSLYEGFGLPVLEAMENNCPVILFNISSFPEVAGQAGIYPQEVNAESLAETIVYTLTNTEFRESKKIEGLAQQTKFSWHKNALEWQACLLEIHQECSEQK